MASKRIEKKNESDIRIYIEKDGKLIFTSFFDEKRFVKDLEKKYDKFLKSRKK